MEASPLDQDDLYGPGAFAFERTTGDCSVDFALYRMSLYTSATSSAEKVRFCQLAPDILRQLGAAHAHYLLPLLHRQVRNI